MGGRGEGREGRRECNSIERSRASVCKAHEHRSSAQATRLGTRSAAARALLLQHGEPCATAKHSRQRREAAGKDGRVRNEERAHML